MHCSLNFDDLLHNTNGHHSKDADFQSTIPWCPLLTAPVSTLQMLRARLASRCSHHTSQKWSPFSRRRFSSLAKVRVFANENGCLTDSLERIVKLPKTSYLIIYFSKNCSSAKTETQKHLPVQFIAIIVLFIIIIILRLGVLLLYPYYLCCDDR